MPAAYPPPETGTPPELTQAVRELLTRLPAYGRLYWRLLRQGGLSPRQQALALGVLAYTISPIDLVPGIIPVVGQMDDLAVALLGLRSILRAMPPAEAEAHLAAVGMSQAHLDADIAALGRSVVELGRRGLVLTGGAALLGARKLSEAARHLTRRGRRPPAPTDA
jgi:uncharacterized membrane protein YkvA (DUF1232 family)